MSDEKPASPPKTLFGFDFRDLIYGFVLAVGFAMIMSGLNGSLGWGMSDTVSYAIGAVIGVVAAVALSWLRKR